MIARRLISTDNESLDLGLSFAKSRMSRSTVDLETFKSILSVHMIDRGSISTADESLSLGLSFAKSPKSRSTVDLET